MTQVFGVTQTAMVKTMLEITRKSRKVNGFVLKSAKCAQVCKNDEMDTDRSHSYESRGTSVLYLIPTEKKLPIRWAYARWMDRNKPFLRSYLHEESKWPRFVREKSGRSSSTSGLKMAEYIDDKKNLKEIYL